VAAAVVTALFGANDTLQIFFSGNVSRFGFFLAFMFFAGWVVIRLGQLQAKLDQKAEIRAAIQALTPFIRSGNRLLEMYGRPYSPGQPPMLMVDHGLPDINEWYRQIAPVIEKVVPEYAGTWENDGPIYGDTSGKAVAIQQLEGRLSRLGDIINELRGRL